MALHTLVVYAHAYMHMQERHHKVVRRYVKDRYNTKCLGQGLAEDLIAYNIMNMRAQPLHTGFIEAHPAHAVW